MNREVPTYDLASKTSRLEPSPKRGGRAGQKDPNWEKEKAHATRSGLDESTVGPELRSEVKS